MKDDGEMARLPDLIGFAKEHDLKIGSIADLIAWRRGNETLVERTVESMITSNHGGDWRIIIYVNTISGVEHIALIKGDITTDDPVLVRMHRLNIMTDAIGEMSEKRHGDELSMAMDKIGDVGRGIVVVLRESSNTSLSSMISQRIATGTEGPDPAQGLREYGVGAQILTDLGVSKMTVLSNSPLNVVSLEGYDLEITDWQTLNPTS